MSHEPAHRSERTTNAPRVRTRHGCWTCRKRRRKCDEQKPRCQNCIGKGLKCQYGLQLTFNEANLFKLMPDEARALSEQAPDRYQTVQFVDGMEDVQELENNCEEDQFRNVDRSPKSRSLRQVHYEQDCNMSQGVNDISSTNDRTLDLQNQLLEDSHYHLFDAAFDSQNLRAEISETRSLQQHYEEPSRGLGETDTRHTYSQLLGSTIVCDGGHQEPYKSTLPPISSLQKDDAESSTIDRHSAMSATTTVSQKNPKRSRELMKFFIDKIAPWLDLCEPTSSYATHLPIISYDYSPLRLAILELSTSQASGFRSLVQANINDSLARILGSDTHSGREEAISARNLLQIAYTLSNPVHSWRSLLAPHVLYLDEMGIHGFRDGNLRAAAWVILRFDLASAINLHSPPLTKFSLWQQSRIQKVSHLEYALILCAKAVQLAFAPSIDFHETSKAWSTLYAQFHNIQTSQRSESHSSLLSSQIGSVTFSKPDSLPSTANIPLEFPLQIHTSRVSFYSSFLGHLISILLLNSQSRNTDHAHFIKLKTVTWHTVQICGLSMSNNILWSWDPVVVTTLLHVGQALSYRGQQIELQRYLRRLEETTAWKFSDEISKLQEFWRVSS